jgi:hypothetical protein
MVNTTCKTTTTKNQLFFNETRNIFSVFDFQIYLQKVHYANYIKKSFFNFFNNFSEHVVIKVRYLHPQFTYK